MDDIEIKLNPIGYIRSTLKLRQNAPMQGYEGAPEAWIDLLAEFADGIDRLDIGDEIIVITWLHQSQRDVLKVHPRSNPDSPLTGVFATRSPDRPNPLGLHRVTILEINETQIKVEPIEAIDGTPVVDIKPVLKNSSDF